MVPSPRVSVILPTFNERAALELLYPQLAPVVGALEGELLIVDDGSPDGTAAYARTLRPLLCTVLERPGVRGLASAVLDGFARARAPVLVVMDADGSHPPATVPALVAAVAAGGAEMALGSRAVPGGESPGLTLPRRVVSRAAQGLARPVTDVHDPMSGFFAVRRDVVARERLAPVGYKIALELIVKCRPRPLVEVPFVFGPRLAGESKLGRREMVNYLRHVGRLYAFAARRRAWSTR